MKRYKTPNVPEKYYYRRKMKKYKTSTCYTTVPINKAYSYRCHPAESNPNRQSYGHNIKKTNRRKKGLIHEPDRKNSPELTSERPPDVPTGSDIWAPRSPPPRPGRQMNSGAWRTPLSKLGFSERESTEDDGDPLTSESKMDMKLFGGTVGSSSAPVKRRFGRRKLEQPGGGTYRAPPRGISRFPQLFVFPNSSWKMQKLWPPL